MVVRLNKDRWGQLKCKLSKHIKVVYYFLSYLAIRIELYRVTLQFRYSIFLRNAKNNDQTSASEK